MPHTMPATTLVPRQSQGTVHQLLQRNFPPAKELWIHTLLLSSLLRSMHGQLRDISIQASILLQNRSTILCNLGYRVQNGFIKLSWNLPLRITSPPTGTSLAPNEPEPAHSSFKATGPHPPSDHILVSNLACVAFALIHLESGGAVGGPPEVLTAISVPGAPPADP